MPKIFGTSLLGILAATIAFYLVGFLIYGILFSEQWMAMVGMTDADAQAQKDKLGIMMWIGGIGITLMQVLGINYVLQQSGASLLGTCAKIGAILAVLIALPLMAYAWLYEGRNPHAVGLDFLHLLVGYVLAAIVLSFFRGKDAIAET